MMTCSKRRGGDIPRRVDDDVAARLGRETRRGTPRERVLSRRRRRRRARTRGVARRGDGRGRGLADRLRTRPRVVVVVVVVLGGRLSDRVRTPARARDGDVRHERGERRFRSVRARRRRERAARARAELGVAPTHGPPGGASSRRRRRVSHQMPSDVFYRDARANQSRTTPPRPRPRARARHRGRRRARGRRRVRFRAHRQRDLLELDDDASVAPGARRAPTQREREGAARAAGRLGSLRGPTDDGGEGRGLLVAGTLTPSPSARGAERELKPSSRAGWRRRGEP